MMPDNDSLLHQIRFILYDAGTPLSAYEIAYRLLTTRLQSSESVELLRQQVCRLAATSPLQLLQHRGLIRAANWPTSLKQTVVAVHRAYTFALSSEHEDLPEWYQPILVCLLCYRFLSETGDNALAEQNRFSFVLQHSTPSQWPPQFSEVLQATTLSESKAQDLFAYASIHIQTVNASFLYQVMQQVQGADFSGAAPFAFIPVVRKLFSGQIREARKWLRLKVVPKQQGSLD